MLRWKFHESIHLVIHSPGIGPTRRGDAIDTPNSPVIRSFADPTSNELNCKILGGFSKTGCDRLIGENVKHKPEVMCLKGLKSTTFSAIVIWCGFIEAFHFLGPRQVSPESSTVSLWVLLEQWPKPWLLLNRGLYYPVIQALWQTPIRIPTNHFVFWNVTWPRFTKKKPLLKLSWEPGSVLHEVLCRPVCCLAESARFWVDRYSGK